MKRLLIAEDKELDRRIFSRHFRQLGYEVTEACDGDEAIDKLSKQAFDLVLTDVKMPIAGAREVLRHLKSTGKDLPVIAMSANMTDEIAEELGMLGAGWTCDKDTAAIEAAVLAATAAAPPKRWCVNQSVGPDGKMSCVADETRDLVCPYPTRTDHSQSGLTCQDCRPL